MSNRYAFINDLELLKAKKPRRQLKAQAPDSKNFLTGNVNLKRLANFGLSILQYLPDFERLAYAAKMRCKAGDTTAPGLNFGAGSEEDTIYVTPEWYNDFTRYGISTAEDITTYNPALAGLTDANHNGIYDNYDTVVWAQSRGFGDDWRGSTWIHGKVHTTDQFDGADGTAGQDIGARFANIDFLSNDGNFIHTKGSTAVDDPTAAALADQSYFLCPTEYDQSFNFMGPLGMSWEEIQGVTGGQSFYNIVMSGSYTSMTPRQATALVAYMFENRERAWQAFSEVLGPVQNTRNDQAMMNYIDEFIAESNPYANAHALTLFPLFLYFQHAAENRLTTFFKEHIGTGYDGYEGEGYDASLFSRQKTWEFVNWLGRSTFNNNGTQLDEQPLGKLYEYRNSLGYDPDRTMAEQNPQVIAVNTLIEKWFGATKVENRRPMWAGYNRLADGTDNGEYTMPGSTRGAGWFGVSSTDVWVNNGSDWVERTVSRAYVAQPTYPSCNWDRKWGGDLYVDVGGTVMKVASDCPGWADIMSSLTGVTHSRINPFINGQGHPNYAVAQVQGLSINSIMSGVEFNNNWVVHAMGMMMKYGVGQENAQMMARMAHEREISRQYKDDTQDYSERIEELAHEKSLDERIALKKMAEAKAKLKKPPQNNRPRGSNGANRTSSGGTRQAQPQQEYFQGSKEFAKALNKMSMSILNGSKKRKELLDKLRNNDEPKKK